MKRLVDHRVKLDENKEKPLREVRCQNFKLSYLNDNRFQPLTPRLDSRSTSCRNGTCFPPTTVASTVRRQRHCTKGIGAEPKPRNEKARVVLTPKCGIKLSAGEEAPPTLLVTLPPVAALFMVKFVEEAFLRRARDAVIAKSASSVLIVMVATMMRVTVIGADGIRCARLATDRKTLSFRVTNESHMGICCQTF